MTPFPNPFELPGHWYRANLHTHSTGSDGWVPPDKVAAAYRSDGYQALAITDHCVVTDSSAFASQGFLTLPGAEFHLGASDVGSSFHVVGVGIDRAPLGDLGVQELIDALAAAGAFVFVAHPYWSGLTCSDLMSLRGYHAIEVYNTVCDIRIARGYSMVHWDDLLTRGRALGGVAVDDSHRGYDDSRQGWLMVKAPKLTRNAIVGALRAGAYYATTGPRIESLRVGEQVVELTCSPVRRISLVAAPGMGQSLMAREGESLTQAALAIPPNSNYARIQVTDHVGRMAWTQPVAWR